MSTILNIIYGLQDPITLEIRYIGRSRNGLRRPKDHIKPSSLKGKSYKNNWLRGLLAKGLTPKIVIVDIVSKYEFLDAAERFWIQTYRNNNAPLTNANDGGDGNRGYRHSIEERTKNGNAHRGMKRSADTCARISVALTGKKLSAAHKLHLSETHKNSAANQAHILELSRKKVARTQCKRGHEFTPANTHIWNGHRSCRTCHAMHQHAHVLRKE